MLRDFFYLIVVSVLWLLGKDPRNVTISTLPIIIKPMKSHFNGMTRLDQLCLHLVPC